MTSAGKLMQLLMRQLRSDGQALPGLILERVNPKYLASMLAQLPQGVVLVTGTNGKTTTVKMVVDLLRSQGLKVLTNSSGSNLTRGLISSVLHNASWRGKLPYDIAVFEIDEGYARQFVAQVRPRYVLALNVLRDQLDRFGEVDAVARLLESALHSATEGVVVNADDPHLAAIGESMAKAGERKVSSFGVSNDLKQYFPHDGALASVGSASVAWSSTLTPDVLLVGFDKERVVYELGGQTHEVQLQIAGRHNYQNAAAALALVQRILPDVPPEQYIQRLAHITEASGRGKVYGLPSGQRVQLVLVKNPAGFLQSLASYVEPGRSIAIAVNDNYADSRDVSWLWDVDFSALSGQKVQLTTGSRAADMALRLQYDGVEVTEVVPSLDEALGRMETLGNDVLIFATYTAMRQLHTMLIRKARG